MSQQPPEFEQHFKQYTVDTQPTNGFAYGTAGFRTKGDLLIKSGIIWRIALLAAARAVLLNKAIGIMITASHNPEEDNGFKIVDPKGEMLNMHWEKHATATANATSAPGLLSALEAAASGPSELAELRRWLSERTLKEPEKNAQVIFGMDTRKSSAELSRLGQEAVRAFGVCVTDLGTVTTPQLHFSVRMVNKGRDGSEAAYYREMAAAYRKALVGLTPEQIAKTQPLFIDGSNGIGAPKAQLLGKQLAELHSWNIFNSDGPLNHQVGADFVKVKQTFPNGVDPEKDCGKKFVSLDGDADRLIYFYLDKEKKFHMLDGDKIATLFATWISEELKLIQSEFKANLGVVQTAYANGSSTQYMKKVLGVQPVFAKTGVKHLHHKAEQFDVGVYFEANGHGTVLFREDFGNRLWETYSARKGSLSTEQHEAFQRLINLPNLINQATGDSLSDILMVEAILVHKGWSLVEMDAMYTDVPNCLKAVKVKDKDAFVTTDTETELIKPEGLQNSLNQLVASFANARSFIRPSGTENVVRIYAEAATPDAAQELSHKVEVLLKDFQ